MGPTALFDKSFLQSLSVDESVWFDQFFYPVICPLFYVETLADLAKATTSMRRSAEAEVRVLADKAPMLSGMPSAHHRDLCLSNLMGQVVLMNGRIPTPGGRKVEASDGSLGVVFEPTPEARAFSRWQHEEFREIERSFAHEWRRTLTPPDLQATSRLVLSLGVDPSKCKTERDAFDAASSLVSSKLQPRHQVLLLLEFLAVGGDVRKQVVDSWAASHGRPLGVFATYAAYVLTVELFFRIALATNIVSAERPSNRIDITYFSYLPFCNVFISGDKLQRRCVEPFLRPDQEFVWGPDLKQELARMNIEFGRLPIEEREKGLLAFANAPVGAPSDLLVKLWNAHATGWRGTSGRPLTLSKEGEKALAARVNALNDAPALVSKEHPDDESFAHLTVKRMIPKKKGSWWLLPKDFQSELGAGSDR